MLQSLYHLNVNYTKIDKPDTENFVAVQSFLPDRK